VILDIQGKEALNACAYMNALPTNKQTNVLFANQWRPYEQNNHIINLYTMITIICVWFKTRMTNTELNVRSWLRACVLYVLVFDLLIYWFKSQFYISIKFNKQKQRVFEIHAIKAAIGHIYHMINDDYIAGHYITVILLTVALNTITLTHRRSRDPKEPIGNTY